MMNKFFHLMVSSRSEYLYSFFRLFYCSLMAWSLIQYSRGYEIFFEIYILPLKKNIILQNVNQLQWLIKLTSLTLVFAGLGFLRKYFLIISLGLFSLVQINISLALKEYTTNISFFILLIFILAPYSRWKNEKQRSPVLMSSSFILGIFYLSSALSKLIHAPFAWGSGELFKGHLFYNYALTGNDILLELGEYTFLIWGISWAVILFELGFVAAIFSQYLRWPFLILGMVMHLSIYYLFSINFFHFFMPVYMALFLLCFESPKSKTL